MKNEYHLFETVTVNNVYEGMRVTAGRDFDDAIFMFYKDGVIPSPETIFGTVVHVDLLYKTCRVSVDYYSYKYCRTYTFFIGRPVGYAMNNITPAYELYVALEKN